MSYILDALKKSQPRGAGDRANIDPAPSSSNGISVVWVWVLGAALALNAVVLGWFVLTDEPVEVVAADEAAPTTAQRTPGVIESVPAQRPRQSADTVERPQTTASTPAQQSAQSRASEPPTRQQPIRTNTQPRQTRPAAQPPVKVALSELDADAQTRYLALSFTSHIFTDDPNLCAVVIDGQRLRNGDTIHGLKLQEITPDGVVFLEQPQGKRARLVSVNPFE